jgi:hypothetical protein
VVVVSAKVESELNSSTQMLLYTLLPCRRCASVLLRRAAKWSLFQPRLSLS